MSKFRELHIPGKPFILANAWDAGSARMLVASGAQAIASTSAGHAFTLGRPDMGHVSRDEAIRHAADLGEAVSVPITGDLENGYGHSPDDVAETVRLAAEAGMAGCCIEDTRLPDLAPYDFNNAVERAEAAIEAAKQADSDFFLVLRADGWMNRQYDFAEAMRRAKAFEAAGADGIYIPLLKDLEQVKEVCSEINVPVNVLCAGRLLQHSLEDFANAGVARISLGSMLARVTHKAIADSAHEMFSQGAFTSLGNAASGDAIDEMLKQGSQS